MADFGGMVLTTKGLNLLAKAQTGAALNITRVAAGAGVWADGTNAEAVTALADEKLTVPIQSMTVSGDGTVKLTVVITNSGLAAGFIFRELGVCATDPDLGEILYAVAYSGDRYDYLPASATTVEKVLDIYIVVGGAQNVTATISPGAVLALKSDINDHNASKDAHTVALAAHNADATANSAAIAAHEARDPAHPASHISYDNSTAGLEGAPSRVQAALDALAARSLEPLSAPLSLYVATTGDDAADGLSPETAMRTIDHAIDIISSQYSLGDYTITINVAPGTYNECVRLRSYTAGVGIVSVVGSGIDKTIIQYITQLPGSASTIKSAGVTGSYQLSDMSILSPNAPLVTVNSVISLTTGATYLTNVKLDGLSTANYIMLCYDAAAVDIFSGCSFLSTGSNLVTMISAAHGGAVFFRGDCYLSGNVLLATVYATVLSKIIRHGSPIPSITGNVTGQRFLATTSSIIDSEGGGVNLFPGTVAGTTATGGQYI